MPAPGTIVDISQSEFLVVRPGYPDRIKHVRLLGTAEPEEHWLDQTEVYDMWPHLLAQVDAVLFS